MPELNTNQILRDVDHLDDCVRVLQKYANIKLYEYDGRFQIVIAINRALAKLRRDLEIQILKDKISYAKRSGDMSLNENGQPVTADQVLIVVEALKSLRIYTKKFNELAGEDILIGVFTSDGPEFKFSRPCNYDWFIEQVEKLVP